MAIGITCASPPLADIGAVYSHQFPVTGDTPPDVFAITVGALPAGLTLDAATGIVSGTPTGPAGTSTFTIQVTDSLAAVASVSCSITVNGALTISGQPQDGFISVPYSHLFTVSGGSLPYVFSIASGVLPVGLSLNVSTGAITGTPQRQETATFAVNVADSIANSALIHCVLTIRSYVQSLYSGFAACACG